MKKIKNILTAVGNPILNDEIKKINGLTIINNDIQYQDGIFEILELKKEIDFIIISQLIPGNLELEELVEKIKKINPKIKIILILEKNNDKLEENLMKKGVYKIFFDNKIEIKEIIEIISEENKMEKYNEEIRKEIDELKEFIKNNNKINEKNLSNNEIRKCKKKNKEKNNKIIISKNNKINSLKRIMSNKKINIGNKINFNNKIINNINQKNFINKIIDEDTKKNKIISILGNNGSGKSVFSVMLAKALKKYCEKILIIDFDILNNSLHTILGVNKYSEEIKKIMKNNNYKKDEIKIENLIININKKMDLISGINLIFDSDNKISEEKLKKIMEKLLEYYDVIIIDTTSECFFEYTKEIIKMSNQSIFLTEANLLEVSKSKRLLEMYYTNWNIEKSKINIVFNKFNIKSIDINLLKNLYSDYNILGYIRLKNDYNMIINENVKNINEKNNMLKKYEFVWKKIY